MRSNLGALVAVAGALAFASVAGAAESFVECPVQQLDTKVTTSLPKGWWATEQRGPLLGSEVMSVSGRTVLVCKYRGFGASIPVMRDLPAGVSACKAAPGGFRCSANGKAEGDGSVRNDAQIPRKEANAGPTVATQVQVEAPVPKHKVDSGELATQAELEANPNLNAKKKVKVPPSKPQ